MHPYLIYLSSIVQMHRPMKTALLFAFLCVPIAPLLAQNIAINADGAAPNASALLDVDATALPALAKKGLLVPRIALGATNVAAPVVAPATSLLVYNAATAGAAPNNVTPGYYYWNGAVWVRFATTGDGWLITGNAGTVAGTNFIGTTDAVDWVIKTGGALAANERMRVRSTGQVVQNNTAHFAGDAFSVYSNTTTNGTTTSINNAVGTFAVNGYASGNGTGVYGETAGGASTVGTAVWGDIYGTATTASSASEGVWGTNSTAPAGTGGTASIASGVRGEATGAAGTAFTMGVLGFASSAAGNANGVYGSSASAIGTGVFGVGTNLGLGTNPIGVYGQATNATGFGMRAINGNAAGTGLISTGNNAPSTYLTNGSGAAFNGNAIAAFAIGRTVGNGIGFVGVGNNAVASIITPASGCGVVGTGAQYGVMGFATNTLNSNPLSNSAANGGTASAGGYFEVQTAGTAQTWAYVGVRDNFGLNRKIIGPGTVNTVVKDTHGNLVALSCPEAPENLFQDYGTARLVNGRALVALDPTLTKNIVVNDAHPLRVFVQLEGECNGVYVTDKSATGFEVMELAGGTSNAPFTYTVVANRADEENPDGTIARYSAERFPVAPGPQPTTTASTISSDKDGRPMVPASVLMAKPRKKR